ncbi:MAG TPA: DUF5723 family protein [Longimicrobium sp.]|nr:DUF5723 family protein [Longimicrobium sp.]
MNRNRVLSAVAAAAALAGAAPAAAQIPLDARALGMGGAYIAVARGQESLYQNPANLGLPGTPHWSVAFPQVLAGITAEGITPGDVISLTKYNELSESERQAILDGIPASGTGLEVDFRAPIFSMQIRRFTVGLGYGVSGSHTLNKSLVDLVLNGFDPSKQYAVTGSNGFRYSYWDFAAAYGRRVGPVSIGAAAHYYLPQSVVRSGFVDQDTIRDPLGIPTDLRVTYAGLTSEGGSGFGLDIGAALQPMPGLTLSASIDNALHSMEFDDETRIRRVTLDQGDYENGDPEQILSEYEESETDFTGSTNPLEVALANQLGEDRDAGLPTTLRAGAAFVPGTGTTVAAAFQTRLEDTPFAGAWEQQLSVGVQQKLPIVTLRAGLASDLGGGSMLSAGLTLGPIQIGIARLASEAVDGSGKREGWVGSFSLSGRSTSVMP